MSGVSTLRFADPAAAATLAAMQASLNSSDSTITTLSGNLSALAVQVGALSPDNVIENGEFTAQAVLDLVKTVHGAGSLLDADLLDGHQWQEVIDLIAAADPMAAIAAASVGGVGTHGYMRRSAKGAGISLGQTYDGTLLRYSGYNAAGGSLADSGSAPTGTWMALSHVGGYSNYYAYGLFIRID